MKMFFRNLSFFLGILLIPLIIFSSYIYHSNSKLAAKYTIGYSTKTIIIGDSHTQKAINDRYFPGSINLSQSSECYIYSFSKLQEILKSNPHVETVLLGCSYHSFSSYYDEFIFGKYSSEISSRYFFIMPGNMKLQFLYKNQDHISLYFQNIMLQGINNMAVPSGKYSFLGCYETYRTNIKLTRATASKRVNTHYFKNGEMDGFSTSNIYYLKKIVDLCEERHIDLFLLNTPMHEYYTDMVPGKFKNKFYSLVNSNKLKLIEFEKLHLADSCFLPDGDHVTENGARLTTLFLVDYLKNAKPKHMEGAVE